MEVKTFNTTFPFVHHDLAIQLCVKCLKHAKL